MGEQAKFLIKIGNSTYTNPEGPFVPVTTTTCSVNDDGVVVETTTVVVADEDADSQIPNRRLRGSQSNSLVYV